MTPTTYTPHNTMSSASAQFASTSELLLFLGEVIANRKLLLDLCLTSKIFNTTFMPFLYSEL